MTDYVLLLLTAAVPTIYALTGWYQATKLGEPTDVLALAKTLIIGWVTAGVITGVAGDTYLTYLQIIGAVGADSGFIVWIDNWINHLIRTHAVPITSTSPSSRVVASPPPTTPPASTTKAAALGSQHRYAVWRFNMTRSASRIYFTRASSTQSRIDDSVSHVMSS